MWRFVSWRHWWLFSFPAGILDWYCQQAIIGLLTNSYKNRDIWFQDSIITFSCFNVFENLIFQIHKVTLNQLTTLDRMSKLFFLNDGGLFCQDFFRLNLRKWISDVTGTNIVFDVEAGNRKLFGRRLWSERTAQKGAPLLTAENHVVWRNFLLNRKISNSWLRAWRSSIEYPLSIVEFFSGKEIFLIADLRKSNQGSHSIAESPIRIMNVEHEAGWTSPLQGSS